MPLARARFTVPAAVLALALCTVIAAPAVRANGLFAGMEGIPTIGDPRYLVIDDYNEDGRADIAAGFADGGKVIIFTGNVDGTFTEGTPYYLNMAIQALEAADVNGDGHVDLVTLLDQYTPRYSIMLGQGNGAFTVLEAVWPDREMELLLAAEMTGDGRQDLVVHSGEGIDIYPGNGDGTFGEPSTTPVETAATDMESGDFDGDGDTDLALVGYYSEDLQVLLNDGSGNLAPGFSALLGDWGHCVSAGDLDGDGVLDLGVGTDDYDGELKLFTGNGDGTFTMGQTFDMPNDVANVAIDDLDRDGTTDMLVQIDSNWEWLHVFLGTGGGAFADPLAHGPVSDGLGTACLGDFNGDDTPDIACGSWDQMLVLLRGSGDGTFPIPAGIGPGRVYSVDTGDLDGDGLPEIVGPSYSRLYIYFSREGWSFDTTWPFPLEGQVDFARTCDLDGNALADLVTSGSSQGLINAYTGNGDGTFMLRGQYEPQAARQVLPCELNNDGITDLAAPADTDVHVLLGTGGGGFTPSTTTMAGTRPEWMASADLDGDGFNDLVVTDNYGDAMVVMFNDGAGGFPATVVYDVDDNPTCLALADVDDDDDIDIALAHPYLNKVRLMINNGGGYFSFGPSLTVIGDGDKIILDDLDGDGLVDLALAHGDFQTNMLSIRRGLGGAAFGESEVYLLGNGGGSDAPTLCADDLDGDGDRDVVFANTASGPSEGGLVPLENLIGLGPVLVTGPGRDTNNPPRVRVTRAGTAASCFAQWSAYGVPRYGTNVACAELTGDGAAEVLTGPGPGAVFGPHVRGFRIDGTPLPAVSFLAYGTNKFGVNVAGGDIDGDGFDEIITGAGPGAVFGPHVRGWNWDGSGAVQAIGGISWFAYGTPKWGVNVCCGDLDGDGYDEIVTGAGPGAVYGPHVRGWNWDGGGPIEPLPGVSFLAYGTNKFGVNVCCGDIDGDGIDELVTGAGPGTVFGAHVRGWNWDGAGAVQAIGGISFFAYDGTRWGANVGCGDIDGDGIDELITGPGPDPSVTADVRCWNFDGGPLSEIADYGFVAYNPWTMRHGVKVAGVRAAN